MRYIGGQEIMEFSDIKSFISKCKQVSKIGTDIYIVGAGAYGRKIASVLDENGICFKSFIDKNGDGIFAVRYEKCKGKKGFFIVSSFYYKKAMLEDLYNIVGISETTSIATFDYHIKEWAGDKDEVIMANEALDFLLKRYCFNTVLDVGCGEGIHSEIFLQHGKEVTALDYGESIYFKKRKDNHKINLIIADINQFESSEKWDCVWCSHLLEHQLNPHNFLKKLHSLTKENGILAITVPPIEEIIQGGHVSIWNAGLLMYHLVLAGFDCSNAHIKKYGYNTSIIVEKHSINIMSELSYDAGDIRKIQKFLPSEIDFMEVGKDVHFWGNIECINWK